MEPGSEIQPQPASVSPPELRSYGGWIATIAILALMVYAQVSQYLGRSPEPQAPYSSELTNFEMAVMMDRAVGSDKPSGRNKLPDLDEDVSRLAKDRHTRIDAAKLYAVIRHEQGYPLDEADVQLLAASKDEKAREYAQIYGSQQLTAADVAALDRQLLKGDFADKMALVHAHERLGDKQERAKLLDTGEFTWRMAVIGALMFAGALGVGLWALYAMRRMQGHWAPLGHPALPMTPLQADAKAYRFALFLTLFSFAPLVILLPFRKQLAEDGQSALAALIGFASLLVVLRVKVMGERSSFKEVVGDTSKIGNKILWGLGGAIANVPIVLGLGLIGLTIFRFLPAPSHPAVEDLLKSRTGLSIGLFFFSASIMAPLMEEASFRGMLLPAIARLLRSPNKGILWSSVAFALIHPQGPSLWLPLFAIGAMGSLLAYQTRSLIPSMVMHAFHNAALLILTLTVS